MLASRLFQVQFAALVTVAAAHLAAHHWGLYDSLPLVDVPIHFTGGLWFGFISIWLYRAWVRSAPPLLAIFLAVLAMGCAWEVFEYAFGISTGVAFWYYVYDTSKDILMDCLGGLAAFALVRRLRLV